MLLHSIESLSHLLVSHLWQMTITLAVLITAARCIGGRSAHWAYALLIIAALKCLYPPIHASYLSPFSHFTPASELVSGIPDEDDRTNHFPRSSESLEPTGRRLEVDSGNLSPGLNQAGQNLLPHAENADQPPDGIAAAREPITPVESAASDDSERMPVSGPMPPPMADNWAARWSSSLGGLLLVLWGIGGGMLLVSLWIKHRQLTRLIDQGEEFRDGALLDLVHGLCRELDITTPVRLVITDSSGVPGVYGVRHSIVLLPRLVLDRIPWPELRLVLAHELNHLRRRDTVCGAIQILSQIVWWFHPLVWWMNRLLRQYREQCCDEEVIARLNCRPADYARCLLKVLELRHDLHPAVGLSALSPFEVTARRLQSLLRRERGFAPQRSWLCFTGSALLALIFLPGAALPRPSGALASSFDRIRMDEALLAVEESPRAQESEPRPEFSVNGEFETATEANMTGVSEPEYRWTLREIAGYRLVVEARDVRDVQQYEAHLAWQVVGLDDRGVLLNRFPSMLVRQRQPARDLLDEAPLANFAFPVIPDFPSFSWNGSLPGGPPDMRPPSFTTGAGSWGGPGRPAPRLPGGQAGHPSQGVVTPLEHGLAPAGWTSGASGYRRGTDRFALTGGGEELPQAYWLPFGLGDALDLLLFPLPPLSAEPVVHERLITWTVDDLPDQMWGSFEQRSFLRGRERSSLQVIERREGEWILLREIERLPLTEGAASVPLPRLVGSALVTWDLALGRPRGIEFTGELWRASGETPERVALTAVLTASD